VNQTLVRSINTTVVALLPIFAILVVGFTRIGPGTLLDLSLALFVGIAVGAYSSIFIATPLLVWLRRREPAVVDLEKHAQRVSTASARAAESGAVIADVGGELDTLMRPRASATSDGAIGRPVHKYASTGPRNQPKRPPRSKR
jgi:preprotein translocase subunit SecF